MFQKKELPVAFLSGLFFGIFIYIIGKIIYPPDAYLFAAFSHIFTTVVLYVYLVIHNKRMRKRYWELEKAILSPVFYKANGNFQLAKKVVNGNIYFTESGILFASLDEKPYRIQELPLSNILKYEMDTVHLNIYSKDHQVFVITTSDVPKISDVLTEKGWIVR